MGFFHLRAPSPAPLIAAQFLSHGFGGPKVVMPSMSQPGKAVAKPLGHASHDGGWTEHTVLLHRHWVTLRGNE